MTEERTARGIRRELSIQAARRGHEPTPWRQVNDMHHARCKKCGCVIAGDGAGTMHYGVADCALFVAALAEATSDHPDVPPGVSDADMAWLEGEA